MTTPSGRHEPGDPTAANRGGAGSPIRPVLAGRRGLRQQVGIIAVAAAAITVIAAGIGLGGRGTEPLPSLSGAPPAASGAATSESPSSSAPATPPPTELPGLGCLPASPGDLPEFRVSSSPAVFEPVRGVKGPPDWALSSPPTAAWPVPNPRLALVLDPSASIVLIPEDEVCVRYATVEYLAIEDLGGTPTTLGLSETNVNPPRPSVVLGSLPAGDWVVRVVAYYSTGVAGNEDQAVMERFFRVITGLAPGASPLMTPTVACVPLRVDGPLPRLAFVAGDDEPVLGVEASAAPDVVDGALVTGTFPDHLVVSVIGEACATSWRVQFQDPDRRQVLNEVVQENPGENPFFVSQNRIDLPYANLGHTIVSATLSFGRGRQATAVWDLTLAVPPPPAAEVLGPTGARVAAGIGCGMSVTLADGRSAWEYCETSIVPEGLEVLHVRRGEIVRLEVPGWPIRSWWIACGERAPSTGAYEDRGGCGLGGAGDGTRDVGPARFLPFPGRHVVSAWVTVGRPGETILAQYFVEIEVEP
jgi:hypothetical protein